MTQQDDQFCTVSTDVTICFRTHGDPADPAVVLISGLGQDLTSWSSAIVDRLVDHGRYVVRIDNRDCGRSTRLVTPPPGPLSKLLARPRSDAYSLSDMAQDTIGVLDHLGLETVDVVGMSMGGMIGQTVAATHPQRIRTLTSIFSTTGARKVGQPAPATMLRMARRPARTLQEHVPRQWAMTTYLGSTVFPPDRSTEELYARSLWIRGAGPRNHEGVGRQISAIQKSGDRTAELNRITASTLVIHGDRDLMVHPSGGAATAAAIPGSRYVVIESMGHHLAPALAPRLVALITDHVDGGQSVASDPSSPTTGDPS